MTELLEVASRIYAAQIPSGYADTHLAVIKAQELIARVREAEKAHAFQLQAEDLKKREECPHKLWEPFYWCPGCHGIQCSNCEKTVLDEVNRMPTDESVMQLIEAQSK